MASRDLHVNIDANTKPYTKAMSRASTASANFQRSSSRSFKRVGTRMSNVGTTMTRRVTLPLAAVGAASVKAAIDWESAWTGVQKTVDGTTQQMDDLQQGLRDMAKELPATHEEIAGVAEVAGQLGVGVEDIEEFTRTMIDLGETTNLTAEEAATSIARFANIMGTPLDEVDTLGSAIVELGNNSATTEAEILNMATRMAAAGQIAGLSESDVLAFAAAASSVGVRAESGGTALSKAFQEIDDAVKTGGDNLQVFSEIAGVSASEFATAFREDPADAIAMFIGGLGRINEQGGSVTEQLKEVGLGGIRVRQALLSTSEAGPLLADSLEMSGQAMEDNSALSEEAALRYETLQSRLEVLRNEAVDLGIQFGEAIIPAIESIMPFLSGLVEGFAGLPDPAKTAIVAIAGITAVVGPLLAGLGSIITNAPKVAAAIRTMTIAVASTPWGAAAAAAGIALGAILTFTDLLGSEASESVKNFSSDVEGLVNSMRGVSDPMTVVEGQAREMLASNNDLARSMEESGMSLSDLVDGLTAFGPEAKAFRDRLREGAAAAGLSDDSQSDLTSSIFDQQQVVGKALNEHETLKNVIGDEAETTDDASVSAEGLSREVENQAEEAQEAASSLSDLQDTVSNLSDKFEEAQERAQRMQQAFDDVFGVTMSAEDAAIAYEQSVDDLTDSIEENGTTLDITTQKGRDNRQAIKGVSDEILNNIDVLKEQGASNKEVRETVNGQIEGLKEQMRQLGFTEGQVNDYIDTLGLTPKNVDTAITTSNQRKTREQLEEHLNQLDEIPPEKASEIQALIDEGKLGKARKALNGVSEPRDSEMNPEVNKQDARRTDRSLWEIAQSRNSRMNPRINHGLARSANSTLWGIAQSRNSRMDARINHHLARSASGRLWGIAQSRNSRMDARVNHHLARSANSTLWGIAQTRNSTMWASADNVWGTEGTLNNVARTRTATINVVPNVGNFFGALPGGLAFRRAGGGTVGPNEPVTLVGEKGPELVSLPAGSEVHTAAETRGMVSDVSAMQPVASGGASQTINQDVTINMPPGSDGDDVLRKLQQLERRRGPLPIRTQR